MADKALFSVRPTGLIVYYARIDDVTVWGMARTADQPSEEKYFVLDGLGSRVWWNAKRPGLDLSGRFYAQAIVDSWALPQAREVAKEEFLATKAEVLMGHNPNEPQIASLDLPEWAVESSGSLGPIPVMLHVYEEEEKRLGVIHVGASSCDKSASAWVSEDAPLVSERVYALEQEAVFKAVNILPNGVEGIPELCFTEGSVYLFIRSAAEPLVETANESFVAFVGRRAA